jgi:hypothetical protein
VEGIAEGAFMNEKGIYEITQAYIPDLSFSTDQLNDWIGKDGRLDVIKRKRIDDQTTTF